MTRKPQVVAQALLRVEREGEAEIGVERALVELVEQHRRRPLERRIVENLPCEHALGDDLDAWRFETRLCSAHAQADRLADFFAERRGHAGSGGACGEPARLEQEQRLPLAHGSSSSASGARVVLPAPGGATSTALWCPLSAARRAAARRRSAEGRGVGLHRSHRGSRIIAKPLSARWIDGQPARVKKPRPRERGEGPWSSG